MAEDGAVSKCEYGSHPTALVAWRNVPDCIDAPIEAMEPTGTAALHDCRFAQPRRPELADRNGAVLAPSDPRDQGVRGT